MLGLNDTKSALGKEREDGEEGGGLDIECGEVLLCSFAVEFTVFCLQHLVSQVLRMRTASEMCGLIYFCRKRPWWLVSCNPVVRF